MSMRSLMTVIRLTSRGVVSISFLRISGIPRQFLPHEPGQIDRAARKITGSWQKASPVRRARRWCPGASHVESRWHHERLILTANLTLRDFVSFVALGLV